jgi:hypothetical protein
MTFIRGPFVDFICPTMCRARVDRCIAPSEHVSEQHDSGGSATCRRTFPRPGSCRASGPCPRLRSYPAFPSPIRRRPTHPNSPALYPYRAWTSLKPFQRLSACKAHYFTFSILKTYFHSIPSRIRSSLSVCADDCFPCPGGPRRDSDTVTQWHSKPHHLDWGNHIWSAKKVHCTRFNPTQLPVAIHAVHTPPMLYPAKCIAPGRSPRHPPHTLVGH